MRHSSWLPPSHSLHRTAWHQVSLSSPSSSSDPRAVSEQPHSHGTGGRMGATLFSQGSSGTSSLCLKAQVSSSILVTCKLPVPPGSTASPGLPKPAGWQDPLVQVQKCNWVSSTPGILAEGFAFAFSRHCCFFPGAFSW